MDRATYYEGDRYYLKIHGCQYNGKWVDRLAAYENTNLEPAEIEELKERCGVTFQATGAGNG